MAKLSINEPSWNYFLHGLKLKDSNVRRTKLFKAYHDETGADTETLRTVGTFLTTLVKQEKKYMKTGNVKFL